MLAIELTFLSGSFHATPWGRNVNEGVPEWPPSPYRLVRALYDIWRRKRSEWSEERVEPLLAALASEPPLFNLPLASASHIRSFLSENSKDISKRQLVFDAFVVLAKGSGTVIGWPNVGLDETQRADLEELLSLMNYLGRSESWVAAKVLPPGAEMAWNCRPLDGSEKDDSSKSVQVACPLPLHTYNSQPFVVSTGKKGKPRTVSWLEALAWSTAELLDSRMSEPPAFRYITYLRSDRCFDVIPHRGARYEPAVNAVLYGLESKVLPRVTSTIEVSERVRRKLMGIHKRIVGDPRKVSPRFSGKDENGILLKGHRHAYILPLDRDQDGKLDHLLVACKEPFSLEELLALDRLRTVWQSDGKPDIQLVALEWGRMGEITGTEPKTRFTSMTPFLPPRHYRKGRGNLMDWLAQEVCKEAENHGLPRPIKVTPIPRLICSNREFRWLEFRRSRKGESPQIGYGFEIIFPEPVVGPMAIGQGAHFGLGIFMPA
ncbi:MAG TPA: type I-U CRISPR-associated protein Csb2 [Methanotrichaceae archaeon]|nr:type I-U CRISPR-associated protein Csb2 [Methanotrichaceae archaeon]